MAFVIGRFNCVESFSQLIQPGKGGGAYPLVDERKLSYFPFLKRDKEPTIAKDLRHNYANAYRVLPVNPISARIGDYNCIFLGSPYNYFILLLQNRTNVRIIKI